MTDDIENVIPNVGPEKHHKRFPPLSGKTLQKKIQTVEYQVSRSPTQPAQKPPDTRNFLAPPQLLLGWLNFRLPRDVRNEALHAGGKMSPIPQSFIQIEVTFQQFHARHTTRDHIGIAFGHRGLFVAFQEPAFPLHPVP